MKYLGWILLFITLIVGLVLYKTQYGALQDRYAQQAKEKEMWISKTEQLKRHADLNDTRQQMAPDVSLLLADMFTHVDSFSLTKYARDTLAALAVNLRRIKGEITITVFTDDSTTSLYTRVKYPDAFSYSAAKGAAIIRYLRTQGITADRLTLQAYGQGRPLSASLPDLRGLSSRRVELRIRATE